MDAAWQPQQGRINWLKYSSPQTFFPLAGKMTPWFAGAAYDALGAYDVPILAGAALSFIAAACVPRHEKVQALHRG